MTSSWPWLALVGLGLFHGLNPAMGWLFAVALGLHRGGRRTVLLALLPIALGHAAAVLAAVLAVMSLGAFLDPAWVRRGAGLLLIGWAVWHARHGHRHRVRFGMTTGMAGLAAWSFVMATAHGAGLMLVPLLGPLGLTGVGHEHHLDPAAAPVGQALAAVAIHGAAMLTTMGAVALLIHDWLGTAVLRRGWVNLELMWTAALIAVGMLLLL